MVTTVVDLTSGLGGRTTEEILALTKDGAVKEYSEILPDGRTITYSLEVEEELFEEEEDIEEPLEDEEERLTFLFEVRIICKEL